MIRIVLVDDHPVVRDGLRLLLEQRAGMEVVGEAATRTAAIEVAIGTAPDVVVLDIGLDDDGVPVIEALRARAPAARILVLSMYADAETVRQALLAGAAGYVVKGASADELIAGIHAVAAGRSFLHSAIADVVLDDGLHWLRAGESPLSPREREVLGLLGGGRTASTIGRALGISTHTVRRHLSNAAGKIGLHGTRALVRYAIEHGIARPASPPHPGHGSEDR